MSEEMTGTYPWPAEQLTEYELLVVRRLGMGSTDAIAAALYLSPHTVKHHIHNASQKLGTRSRTHLLYRALCTGQMSLGELVAPAHVIGR